jgi:purine-binding chemotaxis protein CheW
MHQKFGVKANNHSEYAIIIEINGNLVGFAVEEVKEVRTLDHITPPPPLVSSPFIGGIVNLPDRMIIQVYPDRILEEEEVQNICEILN